MLRLIGYFVLVLVALQFLRLIPGLGRIFAIPFVGFWLSAIVVSAVIAWYVTYASRGRKFASEKRRLGAVDTPHNQGKLGSLLLAHRRAGAAVPHLENAVRGEPDSAEWNYRLGLALLASRRAPAAADAFDRTVAISEEHAYGAALLKLAESRLRAGDSGRSLEAIARFERARGPSPESAYRRGLALRALGQKEEAHAAFASVGALAAHVAGFQKTAARGFAFKAAIARWI